MVTTANPKQLITALPAAPSLWCLNWQPLRYAHPGWCDFGKASHGLRVGTRRWDLCNAILLERTQATDLRIANPGELPPWWRDHEQILLGMAQEIGLRLVAGRMSTLLVGDEIQRFSARLGAPLAEQVRMAMSDRRLLRCDERQVDWRAFQKNPNSLALGVQVLLAQLPVNAEAVRSRMQLRCDPQLLQTTLWCQAYQSKVFNWLSKLWLVQRKAHETAPSSLTTAENSC